MSAENKSVIDRLTQAFNDGNLDLLDELVAPEFVGHSPLSPEPIQGPEELKGFFGGFRAAMPDIVHPSRTLIAEGDLVVIHMPIEGTFTHQLMGIPPNGKKVSLWMCNVWKVVGGRAVEWWLNMDTLSLMQQLGVVPPLG
jgi:predicted ester cyclase